MRYGIFAVLLLVLAAVLAGFFPAPAAAAHPEFAHLISTANSTAPDALLSASGGRPVPPPGGQHALGGVNAARTAPAPRAPRADLPSPVRSAHRVDGLSLPLLR